MEKEHDFLLGNLEEREESLLKALGYLQNELRNIRKMNAAPEQIILGTDTIKAITEDLSYVSDKNLLHNFEFLRERAEALRERFRRENWEKSKEELQAEFNSIMESLDASFESAISNIIGGYPRNPQKIN